MKIKSILGILCLSLCLLIAPAAAAGGDGTSANPYQIETATELQSIKNDLSAYYILMNDIDLTGISWTPIGSASAGFFGELDGNGKTISNLTLSTSTQHTGFFSSLTSGAVVKDVTFTDCSVTSSSPLCGVVTGSIIMSAAVHDTAILDNVDCVRCTIQPNSYNVGCLIGIITTKSVVDIIDCDIIYCNVAGGSNQKGCFVGNIFDQSEVEMTASTVKYSHVVGNSNVGCFGGNIDDSSVFIMTNCVAENSIAESIVSSHVGCLMGRVMDQSSFAADGCIVRNCIVKSASSNSGGIIGYVSAAGTTASIEDCDIDCCTIVASSSYAGGVIGRLQSGATGIVTGCDVTNCTILASSYAGGICPAYS